MNIFPNGSKFTDCDYEWKSFYHGTAIQIKWKQWIAQQVIAIVGECYNKSVIDIGCGSSPLGMLLGSQNYIGIDSNERKIRFMNDNNKNIKTTKYFCGDAWGLGQFSNDYFDIAMMIEIIEHFHNYREAGRTVKEAIRVLKPNGLLIIATPNFRSPMGIIMDAIYDKMYKGGYAKDHNIRFGKESLNVLCASHGVKMEGVRNLLGADMVCTFRKE